MRYPVVIEGRSQFQVAAGEQSPPLSAGNYAVWAAASSFIKIAPVADDVTEETGYPVGADVTIIRIGRDGLCIGCTADISVHQVGT